MVAEREERRATSPTSSVAGAPDARAARSLAWLLFGRLVLALLSLGIAMGLDALGREISVDARRGLYWTVAAAFLATALTGALSARVRRPQAFALAQIAVDVAIVSSLVYFSGGGESVFSFLYILVTVYAALLFERRVAIVAATLGALTYGALLLGVNEGWLSDHGSAVGGLTVGTIATLWGVQVAALFLVGALASVLSGELRKTGAALVRRTSDLHQLEELHQQTVASLTSGLLTTDTHGSVTSINPEGQRLIAVSAEGALGRQVDGLIPGAWELLQASALDTPRAQARARLHYRGEAGVELDLGVAGSVLRKGDGAQTGYILIFQDVTRVVAMEQDLKRSERMAAVGEMAAHMAHEVRNPLAAITGSVQVLRGGPGEAGLESRRLMDIVVREAERLDRLIADFLQYARPGPTRCARVALDEVALEVSELLDAVLPSDVVLEMELSPGLPVYVDPEQLRQVLWNLCLNGVQSMTEGGVLRVWTSEVAPPPAQEGLEVRRSDTRGKRGVPDSERRWAEIGVRDTGPGIAPADRERIFDPFYTTRKGGSGLGLSTVHRIIESHGGLLVLSSELGCGTTMRVRLPLDSEES